MEENAEQEQLSQTEDIQQGDAADVQANTADSSDSEILIPIKFNRELKQITVDEAASLAQKGMKFDMISGDLERIKKMALKDGHSISEFLDALEQNQKQTRKNELLKRCGGDEELAEHILSLESDGGDNETSGFNELKVHFPEIENVTQLPEEVVEAARAKGTALLDEYLRYRLRCERAAELEKSRQSRSVRSSVGSQQQYEDNSSNPINTEFLKGLWG